MPASPSIAGYTPQDNAEQALPRRIRPEMSGISVGPAIEQAGREFQRVSDENQALMDRQHHQDAAVATASTLADLRVSSEQNFLAAQDKAAPDAQNFTPGVLKGFSDQVTQTLAGTKDPLTKQMLAQHLPEMKASLAERAMQWEAATRVQYRADSVLDNAKKTATAVELNPQSWQAAGAEQVATIGALDIPQGAKAKLTQHVDQVLSEAAGRGFAQQDPAGTLKRLADPNDALFSGMTTEQRTGVEAFAKQKFVEGKARDLQGIYEQNGTTAGVKALSAIDKDPSIPAELRDPIRDQLMRQINVYRDQQREKFAPQIAQLESNIVNGVDQGPKDKATAWTLFEKGAYNTTQLVSTLSQIDHSLKKKQGDDDALVGMRNDFQHSIPQDPKDKDVRKTVSALFSEQTQGVAPGSPEYANRLTEVVRRLGVVPDPAIDWARTSLSGGSAQSAAQAADVIARVNEANPRASAFADDPKTNAMAYQINAAVRAGTDPQAAVEHVRSIAQRTDNKPLDAAWKAQKLGVNQPSELLSRLKTDTNYKPGFFSSVPTVPPAMQGDFDTLTQQYYHYTGGDVKAARDLAAQDLKHVWGVSEVNGKRELMPYAPEAMFPGLTKEVIREDIATTVKGEATLATRDPAKIRLAMDPERTARTQGSQWNLVAPDEHGLNDILRAPNGNPLVYQLPVTPKDYEATRQKIAAVQLDRARARQADRAANAPMQRALDEAGIAALGSP